MTPEEGPALRRFSPGQRRALKTLLAVNGVALVALAATHLPRLRTGGPTDRLLRR